MKRPDLALIDIVIMTSIVSYLTYTFWKYDQVSGGLFIPYLLWCLFATYLNAVIVFKN